VKLLSLVVTVLLVTFCGCGIYTFNGSSLPADLKTVDIPLFVNKSMEANVADEITQELNKQVLSGNLLRIVSKGGDATISGTVTLYENKAYSFSTTEVRQVDVDQYKVTINADVEFYDNKKNKELYKGTIVGEGIYNFKTETEAIGRQTAEKDVVKRILENSVQSW
jgi:hypothetical protein